MANQHSDIPDHLPKIHRRFERWRGTHSGLPPIPEPLWAAAAKLAREHGVCATATVLPLEYRKLKEQTPAVLTQGSAGLSARAALS